MKEAEEWAQRADDILNNHPNAFLRIPVKDIHILICAAIIATNDKKQTPETRELISAVMLKLALSMSVLIPEIEQIYSNIPVVKSTHQDSTFN